MYIKTGEEGLRKNKTATNSSAVKYEIFRFVSACIPQKVYPINVNNSIFTSYKI